MDEFCTSLNDLLVTAFRSVLKLEEQMLARMTTPSLSITEFHLLEMVARAVPEKLTVSEVAQGLSLSMPTITVCVSKLEKKGYLVKSRGVHDGRTVNISLTDKGRRVDRIHHHFHERMVQTIAEDMNEAERAALLSGIIKLNAYFGRAIEK